MDKRLDSEIIDFYNYVIPNDDEKKIINTIFNNINNYIKKNSNNLLDVKLFGSNATGLCLANSDLDICIFKTNNNNKKNENEVNSLKNIINIIKKDENFTNINLISKANVPIIKTI